MYIEQFPKTDIGRGMAARYGIPLHDSPAAALTDDDGELDVGVDHGDSDQHVPGGHVH